MRHVCIAKEIIHGMCGRSGHFFFSFPFSYLTLHSMNAFPRRNDYFPCSLSFSFFWGFLSSFSLLCSIDPQKLLIVCRVCSSAREQGIYLLCNKTCFLRKRVREKEKKSLASNILSYVARNELYVNIRSSLFSKYVCIASFDGEKERERERDKECV